MNEIIEESAFEVIEPPDNAQVVYCARRMLARAGFDEVQQYLVAAAVSELSTNIVRYGRQGTVTLKIIRDGDKTGLEVIAGDKGPGIKNIEKALQENYSTGNGLGLGLPSVKRIMGEFDIQSSTDQGTQITVRKWLQKK